MDNRDPKRARRRAFERVGSHSPMFVYVSADDLITVGGFTTGGHGTLDDQVYLSYKRPVNGVRGEYVRGDYHEVAEWMEHEKDFFAGRRKSGGRLINDGQ